MRTLKPWLMFMPNQDAGMMHTVSANVATVTMRFTRMIRFLVALSAMDQTSRKTSKPSPSSCANAESKLVSRGQARCDAARKLELLLDSTVPQMRTPAA